MNIGPMNDVPLTTAREMFLLDCRAADLASKTLRTYTDILKAFTAYVGEVTVQELTPDHVRSYLADLANRPGRYAENDGKMSSHSLHKHYAVIRTWIRWLYAQKMITERITDLVKPPRLSKRLPSTLSDEEVARLLEDLEAHKHYRFRDLVIFELFLDTGLRLEEMCNLTLDDVNIDGGWIKVFGKGDKEDIVPIGDQVQRDLYQYIHIYRKPVHPEEKALFINYHGREKGYPMSYEGLAIMVRRQMKKIRTGRGKRGAHVMRHTAGTNMIRNGASTSHVRRILRHEDDRITQMYVHLADQDLLDAHRSASPVDRIKTRGRRRR